MVLVLSLKMYVCTTIFWDIYFSSQNILSHIHNIFHILNKTPLNNNAYKLSNYYSKPYFSVNIWSVYFIKSFHSIPQQSHFLLNFIAMSYLLPCHNDYLIVSLQEFHRIRLPDLYHVLDMNWLLVLNLYTSLLLDE